MLEVSCRFGLFFWGLLLASSPTLQSDCVDEINGIVGKPSNYFQRRAWFASEDPLEQAQVLDFLKRSGEVGNPPLHEIEVRRWQEMSRDIELKLSVLDLSWSAFVMEEVEDVIAKVVFESILGTWEEVHERSLLDEKLAYLLGLVIAELDHMDREEVRRQETEIDFSRSKGPQISDELKRAVTELHEWGLKNIPLRAEEALILQFYINGDRTVAETAHFLGFEEGIVRGCIQSYFRRLQKEAPANLYDRVTSRTQTEGPSSTLEKPVLSKAWWDFVVRLSEDSGDK